MIIRRCIVCLASVATASDASGATVRCPAHTTPRPTEGDADADADAEA